MRNVTAMPVIWTSAPPTARPKRVRSKATGGGGRGQNDDGHQKCGPEALIAPLRELAAYVQGNCKNDLAILLSSGFRANNTGHARSQLAKPVILAILNQASTTPTLRVKASRTPNRTKCATASPPAPGNRPASAPKPAALLSGGLTPEAFFNHPNPCGRRQHRLQRLERTPSPTWRRSPSRNPRPTQDPQGAAPAAPLFVHRYQTLRCQLQVLPLGASLCHDIFG